MDAQGPFLHSHSFPWKLWKGMKSAWPWMGLIGFQICILVALFASVKAFLHPSPDTADWIWAAIYFVLIGGVDLLFYLHKYSLIIKITLSLFLLFLGIVIFFSENGPSLLVIVWLTILAAAIGRQIMHWLHLSISENPGERLLLAITLGLGAFACLILVFGSTHFLHSFLPSSLQGLTYLLQPLPVIITLVVLTIILLPGFYREVKPVGINYFQQIRSGLKSEHLRLASLWVGVFAICILGPAIWALSPTIRFDSLVYHLTAPQIYIQNRGIVQITEPIQFYWVHYGEMLDTLGLLLTGQPLPSLITLLCGLLVGGMTFILGRRIAGKRIGLIASLVFFSLPMFYDAGTAYNDAIIAAFSSAMILALVAWWQEDKFQWIVLAGIFSGLALGTKYNALVAIAPAALFLLIAIFKRYGNSKRAWGGLALFGFLTLIIFSPWALYEWKWIGNPFFPYLNNIFHSTYWDTTNAYSSSSLLSKIVSNYILLPWYVTVNGNAYYPDNSGAIIGGLLLFMLPWLYLGKQFFANIKKIIIFVFIFLLIAFFLYIPSSSRIRYIWPLLPLICVLVALNLEAIWSLITRLSWGRIAGKVFITILFVYLFATRLVFTTCGWQISERYPYTVALGIETPQAFLSRTLPVYDAFQYLNQEGDGNHVVASFGNEFRLYTTSRLYSSLVLSTNLQIIPKMMANANTPDQLAEQLDQNGFDYILIDSSKITKAELASKYPALNDDFFKKYTRLEFARNNIFVYHFYRNGPPAIVEMNGLNLVSNPGFETLNSSGVPVSWEVNGSPNVDQSGNQSHSGTVAAEVTTDNILYTTIDIHSGELYTLSEWIRAATGSSSVARLEIMWLNRSHQQSGVTIVTIDVNKDWSQYQMSLTVPDDAAFARIYISAHDSNQVWVDDVCFAQGDACRNP